MGKSPGVGGSSWKRGEETGGRTGSSAAKILAEAQFKSHVDLSALLLKALPVTHKPSGNFLLILAEFGSLLPWRSDRRGQALTLTR